MLFRSPFPRLETFQITCYFFSATGRRLHNLGLRYLTKHRAERIRGKSDEDTNTIHSDGSPSEDSDLTYIPVVFRLSSMFWLLPPCAQEQARVPGERRRFQYSCQVLERNYLGRSAKRSIFVQVTLDKCHIVALTKRFTQQAVGTSRPSSSLGQIQTLWSPFPPPFLEA